MNIRVVLVAALTALSLSACVAYDADIPALYDDPALAALRVQDPFARDPFFVDPVYVLRYDRFGRPFYVSVVPTGPQRFGYWSRGNGRGPSAGGYVGRGRHKEQHTIEDARREPENRLPVDTNPNVGDQCQGENCDVNPPRDQRGDQPGAPVVNVNPDMSVLER